MLVSDSVPDIVTAPASEEIPPTDRVAKDDAPALKAPTNDAAVPPIIPAPSTLNIVDPLLCASMSLKLEPPDLLARTRNTEPT